MHSESLTQDGICESLPLAFSYIRLSSSNCSVRISAVMASRWGWSPVPYSDLPGRLKQIVDYLIGLPDVTNDSRSHVHPTPMLFMLRPDIALGHSLGTRAMAFDEGNQRKET